MNVIGAETTYCNDEQEEKYNNVNNCSESILSYDIAFINDFSIHAKNIWTLIPVRTSLCSVPKANCSPVIFQH